MELKKAIERLNKEKEQLIDAIECSLSGISERNDWGGLVQAIDTVLAELKESKKESKKEGKWKPKAWEDYWFKETSGSVGVSTWEGDRIDIGRYNNIPIFPTKEECERYWHFMDTVKEKSYSFSKEEWDSDDIVKYYIQYDYFDKCWEVDSSFFAKTLGVYYFKTYDNAQYIIDNFKEELLKYWL